MAVYKTYSYDEWERALAQLFPGEAAEINRFVKINEGPACYSSYVDEDKNIITIPSKYFTIAILPGSETPERIRIGGGITPEAQHAIDFWRQKHKDLEGENARLQNMLRTLQERLSGRLKRGDVRKMVSKVTIHCNNYDE